jgi:hypothetical protein
MDISENLANTWTEIYSEAMTSYEDIWAQTEPKLREYAQEFQNQWTPTHESILSQMATITKRNWKQKHITVHFVDCVNGASAWTEDVVLPPFPDIDVEKKLFAHELAHILVPDYFLKPRLQNLSLESDIAHTIVDLIAYFSIKEHITDPERRGIKPNPNYYAQVDKLYPIFENCFRHPEKYQDLDEILKEIPKQSPKGSH